MIKFLSLEYLILKQLKENDHLYKISLHSFLFVLLFFSLGYCFPINSHVW